MRISMLSRRVLSRLAEPRINSQASVIENPVDVSADFHRMNNPPENTERQRVLHVVDHLCPAAVRLKPVRVTPLRIGALRLFVDEIMGSIPLADFRPPVKGDPVQSQAIMNNGSGLNGRSAHRED